MTYKIIGGDGREYGPVTETELRKWIAEGRLNAQSLAKAEGDAEFRPLVAFPEFADCLGIAAPAFPAASYPTRATDWSNRDYQLDIGGCISRGWTLFMDNLGILVGCSALYLLILVVGSGIVNGVLAGVLSQVIPDEVQYSASYMILQGILLQAIVGVFVGPAAGGYCYVFIRTLRGQTASVGDLFSGFQKAFARLYSAWFIYNVVVILCWIPFYIVFAARVGPVMIHFKHVQNPGELHGLWQDLWSAFASTGPIALLCIIPTAYLATWLVWIFPLIIDQGMDVWTAIGTSWKMVHKHWFTVFGVVLLAVIIYMAGLFLCCIGLFFTVGISAAALMYAYETIFCESRSA